MNRPIGQGAVQLYSKDSTQFYKYTHHGIAPLIERQAYNRNLAGLLLQMKGVEGEQICH